MDRYTYNKDSRIWFRTSAPTFSYSDGEESENYLLSVLKNAKDLSTSSPELVSAIRDWPSEYHFSMVRHNLLRPFIIKKTDRILELGCGCGAMSRYFGETGASVIAVEGSSRRAQIAAERCRDLPNVKVVCDNIIDYISDEKFDYVTLIGVLEYAPVFIQSEDPVKTCLERARFFLKDDGCLILAIENQLGLKYFNGCAEDHTSIPYFGINDRYGKFSPVTFARGDLTRKLSDSGYQCYQFYFPFPDYKLPRMIFSSEAFEHSFLNIEDTLCMIKSRDYSNNRYSAFHENLAWPLIARNGLVQDMANSFLVLASKQKNPQKYVKKSNWLVAFYSTERHPAYAIETHIVKRSDNLLEVTKEVLFPEVRVPKNKGPRFFHRPMERTAYCRGKLLLAEFQHQMATHGDALMVIKPWIQLLQQQTLDAHHPMAEIPGYFLDCIPRNIILGAKGELLVIDSEWVSEFPIPLTWVAIRGIVDCISSCMIRDSWNGKSIRDFIVKIFTDLDIDINGIDWTTIDQMETNFQNQIFGRPNQFSYTEVLKMNMSNKVLLFERNNYLEKENRQIKSSACWRVTKPLRLISNPLRHLRKQIRIPASFINRSKRS
jgi:SAM-dependent methyltransferase